MKYFVIGFIIIALAYSLINIFKKFFGKDEISEGWEVIQYLLFIDAGRENSVIYIRDESPVIITI